jgi:hypothetical protein
MSLYTLALTFEESNWIEDNKFKFNEPLDVMGILDTPVIFDAFLVSTSYKLQLKARQ